MSEHVEHLAFANRIVHFLRVDIEQMSLNLVVGSRVQKLSRVAVYLFLFETLDQVVELDSVNAAIPAHLLQFLHDDVRAVRERLLDERLNL